MKTIFTVNVLYIKKSKMIRHRIWGYFLSYKEAHEVVIKNLTDIYEDGYYNYALINELKPGVTTLPVNYSLQDRKHKSGWFKADYLEGKSNPKVTPCDQPLPAGQVFVWG